MLSCQKLIGMETPLLFAVLFGISVLLLLILRFKFPAFVALLISSIVVGMVSGLGVETIMKTLQTGMGNTLGFVAIVVGLGTLLGGILEHSGGATAMAQALLKRMGEQRASWAMLIAGFFIAIPVFFDVAFIVLVPLVYSLQRKTGKSLLLYALPLLAGLAITHAFVPPTPGPVAVAEILGASLGWVILLGIVVGLPTAWMAGLVYTVFISKKIHIAAPALVEQEKSNHAVPSISIVFGVIGLPLGLIVLQTLVQHMDAFLMLPASVLYCLGILGHPFGALLLANIVAWYYLGIKRGVTSKKMLELSYQSMTPAGIIILLTGAGGTFKQMLITTQAGQQLAEWVAAQGIPLLGFAFLAAVLIRLLQGSATVAMITAAGLTAPLMTANIDAIEKALLVLAIAAGASILSHVNDSGFWLVSKYLGMSEKETLRSWSIMTLWIAIVGFFSVCVLYVVLL